MRETLIPLAALLLGAAAGWVLGQARSRKQVSDVCADIARSFRLDLARLRPACTDSKAAMALLSALKCAIEDGTVSMEALRRDVSLAIQQEHTAIREPWVRSTSKALVFATQAAACLKVVDCPHDRDRLLLQDAQDSLERARLALVAHAAATTS